MSESRAEGNYRVGDNTYVLRPKYFLRNIGVHKHLVDSTF